MLAIPIFGNKISPPLSQSNNQKVWDLKSLMINNIQQDVPMSSTAVIECLHLKALTHVSEQLLPIVVAVCPAPLTLLGPCQCFLGQFLVTIITLIGSSAKGITSVKVLKV